MDLSIVIITLNNKNILAECVDSVKRHTRPVSYEIIVVDNGSADGTQSMIRSRFPGVKLIENSKNLGFSRANNLGIKAAAGRYVLILNDDTFIREDSFSKMASFMDKDPETGICGPKLLNTDGSIQRQGSILSAHKWASKTPLDVPLIIGACMFIRRSILDKVGSFDENLFFYNDDLDLCRRVRAAGYRVVYFPSAQVYHIGGYSSKRSPDMKLVVEGFRGGLYFCKKHYGPIAYSLYRALLALFCLAMAPFSLFNRKKLAAYLEILMITLTEQIVYKG